MLSVRPTHDNVFIDIVDRDVTTKILADGKVLHLLSDDTFGSHNSVTGGPHRGARPRWARILEIGPEVVEVKPGDLVLCDTLKWSRGIQLGRLGTVPILFWNIKVSDILIIKDTTDGDEYLNGVQNMLNRMEFNLGRR